MFIGYLFVVRQKRIAMESLNFALGKEKNQDELKRIFRACFRNLGQGMMELIYFMGHPAMIKEKVYFEGKENLDKALSQGKGVIAVSAHFGSFPLMLLRCAQEGYKTNAIIRPARDETIEKHFLKQRSSLGLNTIYSHPRKDCVNHSIRVLRENQLLFIPLDQNFGSAGGVFVDFFGEKAATATGPTIFARRTGAPIVPMFIVRDDNDVYKIIVEPAMELEDLSDEKESILINTQRITNKIEHYVRQYPQEWGWMHRRWKSRPAENLAASSVN
jgi:KDO2-lipid IV(A) lauroyltransferase